MFYPGFISPDTLDQFTQALHNSYGNWHPPVMAGFWHLLLGVFVGPQPMLLFQLLLLWGGLALLLDVILKHRPLLSPLIILLALAPYVQNVAGNIWKDLHMSLSWFFVLALLINFYFSSSKPKTWHNILILLLIFYGIAVRISGFPGSIPLVILWWRIVFGDSPRGRWRMALPASLIIVFLFLQLEGFISKKILHAHDDHIEYKLIAHDLTGLSMRSGQLCFPPEITTWRGFDTAYLFSHYNLVSFDNIWWNPDHKQILPDLSEEQHQQLHAYWRSAILHHLPQYLKMKYEGTLFFLKIRESGNGMMIMYPYIYPNNFDFKLSPNPLRDKFFYKIETRQRAWYMVPWYWLILNVLFLLIALLPALRAHRTLLLIISSSAFFYLAIHFFVYPADTELRYFYWYSLSTSVAIIMTFFCWGLPKSETIKD